MEYKRIKSYKYYVVLILTFLIALVNSSYVTTQVKNSGPYAFGVLTTSKQYIMLGKGTNTVQYCQYTYGISSCPFTLTTNHVGGILTAASSRDDDLIATGGSDYFIKTYYLKNLTQKCSFRHDNQVKSLKFDPVANQILYSGGYDGKFKKWNTTSCSLMASLNLNGHVVTIDIKSDGSTILVGQSSATYTDKHVFQITSSLTISSNTSNHNGYITGTYYTNNGNKYVTIAQDNTIKLMNGATLIAQYLGAFSARGIECKPFTSQQANINTSFFLACIDRNGQMTAYEITSTSITPIYSKSTGYNSIYWIIGKQIGNLLFSFTVADNSKVWSVVINQITGNSGCYTSFVKSSNNICQPCYLSKSFCQQCSDATSCNTCIPGYYRSGSSCIRCVSPCSTCTSSNNCDFCYARYHPQGNDCRTPNIYDDGCIEYISGYTGGYDNCISCQDGFYLRPNQQRCNDCESAISKCEVCSSQNQCTVCLTGYYLRNSGNDCRSCSSAISGCLICNEENNCLQCSVAFKINSGNIQCSNCHATCLTCLAYYNECGSCRPSDFRTLTGTNCICSTGYFQLTLNNACKSCISYLTQCAQCSTSTVCTKCIDHYFIIIRSGKTQCTSCIFTCATCSINYDNCTSCDMINQHRQLSGTSCICQTGYVDSGTVACHSCQDLITGCSICSNYTVCTTCYSNYTKKTVSASNITCVKCPYYCQTCSIISGSTKCTSCPASSFRTYNATSNTCSCNTGYFDDNNTVVCQSCSTAIQGCAFCNTRSICITCQGSKLPDRANYTCQDCKTTCSTCNTFFDSCASCDSSSGRQLINDQCLCSNGSYSSGGISCIICSTALPNCATCKNAHICSSCTNGYTLSQDKISCILCSQIMNGCNVCVSESNCTGCISPFALINSVCKCPANLYTSTNDWGQCKQYKITGLKSSLKVQIQVHQHQQNILKVFVRFRAIILTLINFNLNDSAKLYINNISVPFNITKQNNHLILQTPINQELYNSQIKVILGANAFYNQKQQTLNEYQYISTLRRIYYYTNGEIDTNQSMHSMLSSIFKVLRWVTFTILLFGLVRIIFPLMVFVQIVPLFLLMLMSLPANITAIMQGILSYQVNSIIPFDGFTAWRDITFPPMTMDYYHIREYLAMSKLFDILIIGLVILITNFENGIVRMFPSGTIKNYLRNALIRNGYVVKSLTILAFQPSFLAISGAYIANRQFYQSGQLFNFISAIMIFGFYLVYNFNHASTLSQSKMIKNFQTEDCYQCINYQDEQSIKIILLIQLIDFWIAGAIFIVSGQIYFSVILGLQLLSFYWHLRPNLFKNKIHMAVRLLGLLFFILFIVVMFIFRLSQSAFQLSNAQAASLGIVAIISIFCYIFLVIVQKVLTKLIYVDAFTDSNRNRIVNIRKQQLAQVQLNPYMNKQDTFVPYNDSFLNANTLQAQQKKSNIKLKYAKSSRNIKDFLKLRQTANNFAIQ